MSGVELSVMLIGAHAMIIGISIRSANAIYPGELLDLLAPNSIKSAVKTKTWTIVGSNMPAINIHLGKSNRIHTAKI